MKRSVLASDAGVTGVAQSASHRVTYVSHHVLAQQTHKPARVGGAMLGSGMRLAGVVLGMLLVSSLGCEKKKVDCNAFCEREAQCVGEIAVKLGSATQEKVNAFGAEEKKFLADGQRTRCTNQCNDPAKPAAIDEKWIKCLEHSDCKAFVDCVYTTN
jgi:hypothetical protein